MKKIIALLLSCMLIVWTAAGAFAVVYGEEGYLVEGFDEDSAWEINSVATLVKARDDINDGTISMGRYYKLTADLDISGYTDWEPIGKDSDHQFKGHFNGNGRTITVNISRSEKDYAGLFGYVSGGVEKLTVKGNVKLLAMTAVEYLYAGGIACYVFGGTISDCSFDGNVTLSTTSTHKYLYAGGIAAYLNRGTISGNKFDGKVNALVANGDDYVYAGGIVGYANDEGGVLNLTNNSVGRKDNTTVIKAIYSVYDNSRTYAGGIAGYIDNDYNSVMVTGNYSRLKTQAGHAETLTYGARYSAYNGTFADNEDEEPGDTPVQQTSAVVYGAEGYLLEGYDEGSAWIVDSVATLVKVRDDISDGTITMGRYYKLTADLDISGYTDWEPIGKDSDHQFKGHFNGNGHTITVNISRSEKDYAGLFGYVSGGVEKLTVNGNVKLLATTAVKNLLAGGIAGCVNGGTISDCNFDGNVTLSTTSTHEKLYAGGIAAYVNKGTINKSKFDGKVNALVANGNDYVYAGGIVGYANDEGGMLNLTNNSVGRKDNTTVVKAIYSVYDNSRTYAGGIAGYIDNDYNSVTVTGNFSRLKTQAGHTDTLTYGARYSAYNGTFADNEEYDPDEYTDPVSDPVDAPTITTSALANATLNTTYSVALTATGGLPMTWTIASGTLPAGLTLSEAGIISGTPTTDGTYTVTVTATNTGGSDTKTLSITVSNKPDGTKYTTWNGHRYQLFTNSVTWTEAKEYCESLGGHLATSTSAEENSFLLELADDSQIWLGGTDNGHEGTWEWITGEAWSYNNWDAPDSAGINQPDNYNGEQDALSMRTSGRWDDLNHEGKDGGAADGHQYFICEWENSTPPSITAPAIMTETLPEATLGTAYSAALTATGDSITWTATGLPSGLTIDASTGAISGTPTASGTFTVTVTATNTGGSDAKTLSITISDTTPAPTAPAITTAENLGSYTVGDSVSVTLEASGTTPITWTLTGGNLPDGLTLGNTGTVSGTASKAGTFSFTVNASNSAGNDSRAFTITVNEPAQSLTAPVITTTSLPPATIGRDYRAELEASGSTPVTWTYSGSMIQGLTLSEAGVIAGIPSEIGTLTLIVKAANSAGSDTREITLTVRGEAVHAPVISTKKLPDAFMDEDYSFPLQAEGIVDEWKVTDGTLPEGLSLDASLGEIYGTITTTKAKTFTFKVTASNTAGISKPVQLRIKVSSKSPAFKTETLKAATWHKKYSITIKLANIKASTWELVGDIPDGIEFKNGKLSGTPQEAGEFDFTVAASNGAVEIEHDYELVVKSVPPKLKGSFKKGTVGETYTSEFKATGTTPIEWDFEGLPDGLTFEPDSTGETCMVSGIPQKAFSDKVFVTLSNSSGEGDAIRKSLKMTVKYVKPKFKTKAKDIPDGQTGEEYEYQIVLAAGSPVIEWSYSGNLPEGLQIDDEGLISGTPKQAGKFTFSVTAKNDAGKVSLKNIAVTIFDSAKDTPSVMKKSKSEDSGEYMPDFVNGVAYYERGNLTADMTARAANNGEIIAAILPAIEVEEEGMYDFTASLDVAANEGSLLVWHSYPDGEDDPGDQDNAIFLDDDGEITETVPASLTVTVSAWLEPGIIYEPVIAVKARQ